MSFYKKGRKGVLDSLFSLYIRTRDNWTCQRCGKKQPLKSRGYHCAHIEGRGKESVRWDEENAVGLCKGCHQYIDSSHFRKEQFYISKFGKEKYNELRKRASKYSHFKPFEIEAMIDMYREKIKLLQNG
jgi:hypothetical protein